MAPAISGPSSVLRRQLKNGLPAVASGAINTGVPLLGIFVLNADQYEVWALAATLVTIFLVFDFGAPTLATKLSAEGRLDRATTRRLCLLTAAAPLVLGVAAVAAWAPFADAASIDAPGSDPRILLGVVALGTALRSAGSVYSAILLGQFQAGKRAVTLLIPSTIQLVVTSTALAQGLGVMSLGLGVVMAGTAQVAIGRWVISGLAPAGSRSEARAINGLLFTFLRTRGLVAVLGLSLTQLDRWAVALIAGPELTATYDLCARLALLPKIALIALAAGLVAEGARGAGRGDARALNRRSQILLASTVPVTLAWTLCASLLLARYSVSTSTILAIAFALAMGHGLNTLTLSPSLILAGVGRPQAELRYVVPLSIATATVYGVAIALESLLIFVVGWSASMSVMSVWFLWRSDSYLRRWAG